MITQKRLRKILPWSVLAVYWPLLFLSTHVPRLPHIPLGPSDKVLHYLAYLILTLLFWLARFGSQRPSLRKARLYKIIILFSLYGALDEITQSFVGRCCDIEDWVADICGSLTALLLLYVLRRCLHWLIVYGAILFLICHWPGRESLFDKLPSFFQQFQVAYAIIGYIVLTLLWWRTLCRNGRFEFKGTILTATLFVLPLFALLDEAANLLMKRGFDLTDYLSALGGIAVGIVCAYMLARHTKLEAVSDGRKGVDPNDE